MTYREIAKQLNISPATLSLVLNSKPGISEATRQRVLNGVEELGLSHLIRAGTEGTAPAGNLGLVIFKRNGSILDRHSFFLLLMESLEGQAQRNGYGLLLSNVDCRNALAPQLVRLNDMDIQGAVIFATEMTASDLDCLAGLRYPFVLMDNDFTLLNVDTVAINNEMGTYQAVAHLVKLGYRRIGYLKCSERISSFRERELGYRRALQSFGLVLEPLDILEVRYSEEGSYLDFKRLFSETRELPRAFVTDDDTIVSGFVRALLEFGIRVPQDISVVGFNNRPSCELFSPPLTSVDVPKHSFGAEAVDMLVQLIKKHQEGGQHNRYGRALKLRICTKLVERQSTRSLGIGESETILVGRQLSVYS